MFNIAKNSELLEHFTFNIHLFTISEKKGNCIIFLLIYYSKCTIRLIVIISWRSQCLQFGLPRIKQLDCSTVQASNEHLPRNCLIGSNTKGHPHHTTQRRYVKTQTIIHILQYLNVLLIFGFLKKTLNSILNLA